MSYDYIVWKRSPSTKTAMLKEVYLATGNGKDHEAMAPFDVDSFEAALIKYFGNVNDNPDGPFLYYIDKGAIAPWITINVNHSSVEAVTNTLISIACRQDLMVYDPQREAVWGNKRPAK